MSRYTPILGTLVYVLNPNEKTVLLVHRTARTDDEQFGKWNGLGGKVHADEGIVASARRELYEEALIEPTDMRLRGTVSWPGFGRNGEDWFGFLFLVTSWQGDVPTANEEGTLHWIPLAKVLDAASADQATRLASGLDFYEGDRHFLPLVFDAEAAAFHGVMPYANGRPVSWTFDR
jgi:8-oxo-dGTP diphosphatase